MATETTAEIAPLPARGWTGEAQVRFLDLLAQHGNARAAAGEVGLSVQSAYRLRRREPLFARGWNAALLLARDASEQVLAEVAVHGIEEEVWYRGRIAGTRIRFDARLLLAHLGRLDRLADEKAAARDAGRFDQLLACIAGEEAPPELVREDDPVPRARHVVTAVAAERALDDTIAEWEAQPCEEDENGYSATDEEYEAHVENCNARADEAWNIAGSLWDEWSARAVATVDMLIVDKYWGTLPGLPGNPLPAEAAANASAEQCNLRNPADNNEAPLTPRTPAAFRTG